MSKKEKSEALIAPAEVPEKGPTKVEQAFKMYQDLIAQGLKPKEAVLKIAKRLGVSSRTVRGYIWRAQNPEKFKAMLERYYAKRKARLAAEKKAAAKAEKSKAQKKAEKEA